MITKIKIENIKGFGIPGIELDLNIDSKKVNLGMAPNGFGKSSLTAAFKFLKNKKLDVSEESKNEAFPSNESSLEIILDGESYCANSSKNELYSKARIKPYVINSRVVPGHTRNTYGGYTSVSSFISIGNIDLRSKVEKPSISYKCADYKDRFGKNSKLLSSIKEHLMNSSFMANIDTLYGVFEYFSKVRKYEIVKKTINNINQFDGTREEMLTKVYDEILEQLESQDEYQHFKHYLERKDIKESNINIFLMFFQFLNYYKDCKNEFKAIRDYSEYSEYKRKINIEIQTLNSSGADIKAKEDNGRLCVIFPRADRLSNGQRDVLTFAIQLIKFIASRKDDWQYLLIIDEVFDYLDEANTIAAQFYLSNIVKRKLNNVYVLLLTHLNPYTFRSYLLPDKLVNYVYLNQSVPCSCEAMRKFIALRDQYKKDDEELYSIFSNYFFHYNPGSADLSSDARIPHASKNLKTSWLKSNQFKSALIEEVNKYMGGSSSFDPYSVACALRIIIEKHLYLQLTSDDEKELFLQMKTTSKKMQYCEGKGILIPDTFMIVTAISNEANHLKIYSSAPDGVAFNIQDKAIVYALQNYVVRNILKSIFRYSGVPLKYDALI